jgi:hypothetical protein
LSIVQNSTRLLIEKNYSQNSSSTPMTHSHWIVVSNRTEVFHIFSNKALKKVSHASQV